MVEAMEIPKGFKKTEVGIIPSDWLLVSYDELFDFLTTATYSRSQLSENDTIKYVHYGDIHTKCVHFLDCDKIDLPSIKNELLKNYPLLKDGDLIIVDASEDYEGVGKSVEVKNLKNKKAISGLHTFLLRDKKEVITNGFKGYIQPNSLVKKQMDTLATGMKVYGVSKTNLKLIKIPLPPTKAEQIAIAEALNDADALITELEKLIPKKKAIKQGAMQELLKPKEGWETKKLGDECELITKGTTPTSIGRDFQNSGINFIKIESLTENGRIIKDKVAFINDYTNSLLKRSQLKSCDVLFSIAGALGRVAIVYDELLPANTNQALAIIRLKKDTEIDLKYLFYLLNSNKIKTHIMAINVQGAQANLSLQNISDFQIEYPSKSEQKRIAQVLSDMDAEIVALKKKLDKYKMLKQGMMQNLLTGKIRLI